MKKIVLLLLNCLMIIVAHSQVGVNADQTAPDPSAMLDVKSSSLGFLPPRMSTQQRDQIANPATGLVVFNTDCYDIQLFNGTSWVPVGNTGQATIDTIYGNQIPCINAQGEGYEVVPDPTMTGYCWSVPAGAEIEFGQGTNYITVNFGTAEGYITVYGYSDCWKSQVAIIPVSYTPLPAAPSAGTHVTEQTQITWHWNAVNGATGYKFNTVNNYNTATDLGNTTSHLESGLTCGTAYTRYVWSYNECPGDTPLTMNASTSDCPFICGTTTITKNHMAGVVAPVSKTVTYGTVGNITGASGKCWITQNLGAGQQASSVDDATESSAGWYWQFNRKQGYMHDGTTRTPNTTWVSNIIEDSDWQQTNDPCTIELGTGWRLPTNSEWHAMDISGTWLNWNGPWNSGLNLHAAGVVFYIDGSLLSRGATGSYWSSSQDEYSEGGMNLIFTSTTYEVQWEQKAMAETVRCIKD